MILPTKHIPQDSALIGLGAVLIQELERPQTISLLWEKSKKIGKGRSYQQFILALDMLYITGVISISNGMIRKENT